MLGKNKKGKMMSRQPNIETPRLKLLQFKMDDAGSLQSLAGNYNVAKNTINIPHPYEDGMAETWISTHQHEWDEKQAITYAIFLKSTEKLIGAVGLVGVRGNEGGVGYWIGEPYWGRGYCTEAAKGLIHFCFETLQLVRIEAEHLVSNPASGRVMEKVGMTYKTTKMIKDRDDLDATINVYEIKK